MAIELYSQELADQRVHPKAMDTLIIDTVLYPLATRGGGFGYWRDGTFIPVDRKDLVKHPVPRAGATTWFIKPKGRERVRLDPKKDTQ
jgi:hypothetical protein